MNMNTLINTVKNAVHDDAETGSWCSVKYGRKPKIYTRYDMRKPPGKDDYPLVYIFKLTKKEGYALESQDHVLGISCGVYDEDLKVVPRGNIVEYESDPDLDDFKEKVKAAITGLTITGIMIDSIDTEYEELEFFPFLHATMEINFVHEYYQGDNVFA